MGNSTSTENYSNKDCSSTGCPFANKKFQNDDRNSFEKDIDVERVSPNQQPFSGQQFKLSNKKEISSIPKPSQSNSEASKWIYPSQQQFFNSLIRKGWRWDPSEMSADDIELMVRIHNDNNEETWRKLLKWEICDGNDYNSVFLTSVVGDSTKISPQARINSLFRGQLPFDRHDWIIECNGRISRYVIDYYGIKQENDSKKGYIVSSDVRPALDTFWAIKLRAKVRAFHILHSIIPNFSIYDKDQLPDRKLK